MRLFVCVLIGLLVASCGDLTAKKGDGGDSESAERMDGCFFSETHESPLMRSMCIQVTDKVNYTISQNNCDKYKGSGSSCG